MTIRASQKAFRRASKSIPSFIIFSVAAESVYGIKIALDWTPTCEITILT